MNSSYSGRRRIRGIVGLAATAVLVPGCQLVEAPFIDELAAGPAVTTPSVEAARAMSTEPRFSHRPHAPVKVELPAGTVTHGPLYFQDPYEGTGSDDGRFAWSGEDYFCWLYGPSRFLLNTAFFPVSAAVTPPWHLMESDARADRPGRNSGHNDASSSGPIDSAD